MRTTRIIKLLRSEKNIYDSNKKEGTARNQVDMFYVGREGESISKKN